MAILLARAVLANLSGVAADEAVNDFVFTGAVTPAGVTTAVVAFYNATSGGAHAVSNYLAPTLTRAANMASVEVYDIEAHLDGSPHGSPVLISPFTLGASAVELALPPQLAICLSVHAAFGTTLEHGPTVARATPESAVDAGAPATHLAKTRPRSSLRGRVFLGPINASVISTGPAIDPASQCKVDIVAAAVRLLAGEPGWSVWSRVGASCAPIVGGWVDKQLSVVRRRKPKISEKLAWP